jgi:NTP pyrophosphatase (non-canonical NTP hydrolase)
MSAVSLGFVMLPIKVFGSVTKTTVRYDQFVRNLFKPDSEDLMKLHAALGVGGEAGELQDAIKREVIYGKPADRDTIIEELGDLRFYIQSVMQMYDINEQEILQNNADKLAKRYVELTYSNEEAINRADKQQ